MIKIREFKWIYNSRIDFPDFLVSVLLISLGVFACYSLGGKSYSFYHEPGDLDPSVGIFIHSYFYNISLMIVGGANLLRIFYPNKPDLILSIFLRGTVFFLVCVLFFTIVEHNFTSDHIKITDDVIVYFLLLYISFDSLRKTY